MAELTEPVATDAAACCSASAQETCCEPSEKAALASLGCGNPTAMADLQPGMVVLDLGSGGGIDVLISARRVAPTGTAYGLDMTDEMLDLARANQAKAGVENVEWLKGHIEITETHRAHSHAGSAIIRARKPD